MFTSGSPNQGQLNIGIALVLEDRFSNQAREASSHIRRLHQEAKNATNANLQAVSNIAGTMAGIGTAALVGIGSAIGEGARFIDTMTFVDAIATKTGVTFEQLSLKAKTLGRDTMFSSLDIASGMQFMAMAGQDTQQIFNNISSAADLANATMTTLGGKWGAADIMTNVMKMYKVPSSMKDSQRVADVLTKTVTKSNTNLLDLGEAIKYAGTTTTNLGASLEQTAAMVGVLGNAGIQGSMAGTALANAYRYLSRSIANPDFKGNKALKSLGLSKEDFVDAHGNLIDLGVAMSKIAAASQELGTVDSFNTLVNILGVRGERAGTVMMKALTQYNSLLDQINNSEGISANIRDKRMATLAGSLEKVTSTWENLRTSFTESIAPTLQPWLEGIGAILEHTQALFNSSAGPWVAALMGGVAVFGTLGSAVVLFKSNMRLMFNDSIVSLRSMFLVMKQGWVGATIDAKKYMAIEAAIIAQRKAGIAGAGTLTAVLKARDLMDHPGQWMSGRMMKPNKYGVPYYYKRTPEGGVIRTKFNDVVQEGAKTRPTSILTRWGIPDATPSKTNPPVIVSGPIIPPVVPPTTPRVPTGGVPSATSRLLPKLFTPLVLLGGTVGKILPTISATVSRAYVRLTASQSTQNSLLTSINRRMLLQQTLADRKMRQNLSRINTPIVATTGNYASRLAQRRLLLAGTAGAAVGTFGRLLKTGTLIGRGLMGMFGGPWGLALMGIVTFLPMIIGKLSENKDSLDQNTSEMKKSAQDRRQGEIGRADISTDERSVLIARALEKLSTAIDNIKSGNPGDITIVIDGKTMMKKQIKADQSNQIINVGGTY